MRKRRGDQTKLGIDPTSGVTVVIRGVDRGTDEAREKKEPDWIAWWKHNNIISQDDFDCAREIETAFSIITTGASIRHATTYFGGSQGCTDWEPGWQARLQHRYFLWVLEMERRKFTISPVLGLCVDGLSFTQMDRKLHRRNGWSKVLFIDSMKIYLSVKRGTPN